MSPGDKIRYFSKLDESFLRKHRADLKVRIANIEKALQLIKDELGDVHNELASRGVALNEKLESVK